MKTKPSPQALRAARKLRIKIHGMDHGNNPLTGLSSANHPDNSEWLDAVTPDDARLIDEEMGQAKTLSPETARKLVDILQDFIDIHVYDQCYLEGSYARINGLCLIADKAKAELEEE